MCRELNPLCDTVQAMCLGLLLGLLSTRQAAVGGCDWRQKLLVFLFCTVELFEKIFFGVCGPLRQMKLMRDPLMTADIRDAMGATYRQAQEEVAVDRIAQVFGAPAQVRSCVLQVCCVAAP